MSSDRTTKFDKKGNALDQLAIADQIEKIFPKYAELIRDDVNNIKRGRKIIVLKDKG